jgi:phosphatidylinositol alpha-mannosyltransferase
LKIGFVLDDTLDSSDGVQQYVLTLGSWLSSQGHQIHYLVGQTSRHDLPHIHSLSKNISVRFNGNRLSMPLPASKARIRKLLAAEQFDILHVQLPYSPFMAARVIKAAPENCCVVGTFHILPFGWLQYHATRYLFRLLKSPNQRLEKVWSVSKPAQQFAAQMGVASTVLPNAINFSSFKNGHRHRDEYFKVVFLGRLVPRKGCADLLKAMALINKAGNIPNLRVIIGGKGPQGPKLARLANNLGLQKMVKFVGFVEKDDKADFLANADVAVFPSLGAESFGIILLEAMAARAGVVLAGNNSGYRSVMRAAPGSLFDPTKPGELADRILELYKDKQQFNNLHARQQSMVLDYDVADIGKKLVSYYLELKESKTQL